jgi:hypothetical protein
LGNTEIQIEEGQLPKGKTFVNAVSLLGNTIIRVPPSIRVTLEAKAILGNATIERGTGIQEQYPSGCPELVITGGALLGNLVVEVRKPRGAF